MPYEISTAVSASHAALSSASLSASAAPIFAAIVANPSRDTFGFPFTASLPGVVVHTTDVALTGPTQGHLGAAAPGFLATSASYAPTLDVSASTSFFY